MTFDPSSPETRIRWIVNTSAEEGRAEIKRLQADQNLSPADLRLILATARQRELAGANRSGLLAAIESAVNRIDKEANKSGVRVLKPDGATTIVEPSWDRARSILSGIKTAIRLSLAGQVMLGAELQQLKKGLGFVHGRNQHTARDGKPQKTWEQHVRDELDLSRETADRMIACWESARTRLKKLGGQPALIGILETPPAALTAVQRQTLEAAVHKITDGDTQRTLLEELKLVKLHDTSGIGGDTSSHRGKGDPATVGQLAFAFFTAVAEPLRAVCTMDQREAYFHAMAEEFPAELSTFEQMLETALAEVRAAKARRVTPKA